MDEDTLIKLQTDLNHLLGRYYQKIVVSFQPLETSSANQLFFVVLDDGSKYVLKIHASSYWLGIRSREDISITEQISHHFSNSLKVAESAWLWPDQSIWVPKFEEPTILFPWVEGCSVDHWDMSRSYRLGKMLAQMHSNQPKSLVGNLLPKIDPSKFDTINALYPLAKICYEHFTYRSNEWIVGHRDLHAGNVIWVPNNEPKLIDWESAGQVHPFVELLGLAVNASGIVGGAFSCESFKAVFLGYLSEMGSLPFYDDTLWALSYQTWLLWYDYLVRTKQLKAAKETLQLIVKIDSLREEMDRTLRQLRQG